MDLFTDDLKFNKIIFRDKFYFPDQINHEIQQLVNYIKSNTISDTPFIYLFAQNHIKTIIAYFAIIKSGHVCILVEPDIKPIELADLMQDTPPCVHIIIKPEPDLFDYQHEVLFLENKNIVFDDKQLNGVCTIAYTAAEDGFYKGALLTKKNLLSNAQAILDCDLVNTETISCALVPFNHMYALQTGILAPLLAGSSLLIENIKNIHQFRKIISSLQNHCVTNIYSIPMMFHLMTRIPDIKQKLMKVHSIVSGGCTLSPKIFNLFLERTGKELRNGYGLTEASPICSWHRPQDKIKIDSIGRAFSCCQIKILNSNNEELPIGQTGEICIKGDNVMKGYYNHKQLTDIIINNGWLHTGDLGSMDHEGYVYFKNLKKNMLNSSGKNVYPKEVERLLKMNENVLSALIYGEADDLQHHIIKGKITLKINGAESVEIFKRWCIDNISQYKIPHIIECK